MSRAEEWREHARLADLDSTSPEMLVELLADRHLRVRTLVLNNKNFPPDELDRIVSEGEFDLCRILSQVEHAPLRILQQLLSLWTGSTLDKWMLNDGAYALAGNPSLEPHMVLKLYDRYSEAADVCDQLASNPAAPSQLLHSLAAQGKSLVSIAVNPAADSTVLTQAIRWLADETNEYSALRRDFISTLLERDDLDDHLLRFLCSIASDKSECEIALHDACGERTREAIMKLGRAQAKAAVLSKFSRVPDWIMASLPKRDARIRAAVAAHPSTSKNILDDLSRDRRDPVRLAVAENPRTPRDVLKLLAFDSFAPAAAAATKQLVLGTNQSDDATS